jgi:hypothetical protein
MPAATIATREKGVFTLKASDVAFSTVLTLDFVIAF